MKKALAGLTVLGVATLTTVTGGTNIFAHERILIPPTSNHQIAPYYTTLTKCSNDLSHNSKGKVMCEAKTQVRVGYTAGIEMELQQKKSGSWTTIKTWSDEHTNQVELSKSYYIEKGYSYRLKLTHTAIDSNDKVVETATDYSSIVSY